MVAWGARVGARTTVRAPPLPLGFRSYPGAHLRMDPQPSTVSRARAAPVAQPAGG
jgi:hypothetical protein